MIHYRLRCAAAHEFEGWFQDSAGFDKLAASGLVECTQCGSTTVARALMAPAVRSSRKKAKPPVVEAPPETLPPAPVPAPPQHVAGPVPAQLMAVLQRMRAEVERHCDYVGPKFAEEARRIHKGESDARGIYGEATPAEAEALADEGIEVAQLPWVKRAES
jgi:hypothetical protein